MATRTVKQEVEKRIEVCDVCERDCSNGFSNHCYFCRRQCCLTCSRLIDLGGDRDRRILELPIKVCCTCEKIGVDLALQSEIAIQMADEAIHKLFAEWRKRAKVCT